MLLPAILIAQKKELTDAEIKSFKTEVAKHAENLESLSSDFNQVKYMQLMKDEAVSEGKLYYKTPDVLKWEYHEPYNYHILFKENQLFLNDDGVKSSTNLKANKLFGKLVSLISGSVNGKLLEDPENFKVTYYNSGKNVQAIIVPLDESVREMFSEIIMIFNGENFVDSVKLMEENGDYTHITFRNITLNAKLDPAVFQQ
ncbi:outer membrane lipoprotein carrier protein LolA [Antarcticibacterium sp. 1MA-6-2]|uniref:LolA family protein n=1 Tax=Antarcticibacterium sp. 1MA-6-2 TaxID=2908210 RepID=UPI001F202153|nr:outer membrane lipoprotein carrier protein LolA [Antarcticibacterium sp. 1MA-6-2]UJH91641.1 outer membrane lipoprotein carrier protein LolA [Antarcticibacterium sp. 1MA-6-2]